MHNPAYTIGSFDDLSRALLDIKERGATKSAPRHFVLGSLLVHLDDEKSSDEPRRLYDVSASLKRHSSYFEIKISDSAREYGLLFPPRADLLAVYPADGRFAITGLCNDKESNLIVYR